MVLSTSIVFSPFLHKNVLVACWCDFVTRSEAVERKRSDCNIIFMIIVRWGTTGVIICIFSIFFWMSGFRGLVLPLFLPFSLPLSLVSLYSVLIFSTTFIARSRPSTPKDAPTPRRPGRRVRQKRKVNGDARVSACEAKWDRKEKNNYFFRSIAPKTIKVLVQGPSYRGFMRK